MKKLLVVEEDGRIILFRREPQIRETSPCVTSSFGIRAMERAGTGLVDVTKLMTESSGTSEFFHNATEQAFTAVVSQAASSAGSRPSSSFLPPDGNLRLKCSPVQRVAN